ncbi:MAG: type IV toxin-antitoxin system AbiEi family antitoxin domain-containing protein [Anaerolineales bacterium]
MSTGPDANHLYEIAESQAGYFTARQATRAGYTWERLSHHAKMGRFQRVSHGIYRLTQFPASSYEDLHIALLRTGPKSVISHESALSVYELSDVLPAQVHVIVPRTASRRRLGLRLHTNRLASEDITMREGLRITTPARTIVDVAAGGLSAEHVQRAIEEALQRGLATRDELFSQAERRSNRVARNIRRMAATVSHA